MTDGGYTFKTERVIGFIIGRSPLGLQHEIDYNLQCCLEGKDLTEDQLRELRDKHVNAIIEQNRRLTEAINPQMTSDPVQFYHWLADQIQSGSRITVRQIDGGTPEFKTAVAAPAEDTRILLDPASSNPQPPYSSAI